MRLLVAMAGMSVVIGLAAPAHTDPDSDAAFLAALHAAGITFSNADEVVMAAHTVCTLITDSQSAPQVLVILEARNPELGPEHAAKFMGIAVRSYCPDKLVPATSGPAQSEVGFTPAHRG